MATPKKKSKTSPTPDAHPAVSRFATLTGDRPVAAKTTRAKSAKPTITGHEAAVDEWVEAQAEADSADAMAKALKIPLVQVVRDTFAERIADGEVVQTFLLAGNDHTPRGTVRSVLRSRGISERGQFEQVGLLDGPTQLFEVAHEASSAGKLLDLLVRGAEQGKSAAEILTIAEINGVVRDALLPVDGWLQRVPGVMRALPEGDRLALAKMLAGWVDAPALSAKDFGGR